MEANRPYKILKDDVLDQQLFDEGYVIIPFLTDEEVHELKTFYRELSLITPKGFHATAHVDDPAFRSHVNEYVKSKRQRAIDEYFENCMPLGGSYIVKGAGEEGKLMPHQDWNIVDEDAGHRSFNVWTALVDTNVENGAILILEKSHDKMRTFRGANIPCPFYLVYDEIWPRMKLLPMTAGEALVFDHRLLHASHQNKTDELRVATVYGIISKSAEMRYYYKHDNYITEYKCNPEFYIHENPFKGPTGLEKTRDLSYEFPELKQKDFFFIFKY